MDQIARSPQQIGDVVRRQRRRLGLNQTELGEKTNLRQATISAVETGKARTEFRVVCDILAALDLELVIRPRSKSTPDEIEALF